MRQLIVISFIVLFSFHPNTSIAQKETFTCYQYNYGEGKGWQNSKFNVIIDMDNYKISIYDPNLQTIIRFSPTAYTMPDGVTTLLTGEDQSHIPCKVFIAETKPPTVTVQYANKFHQMYRLR